MKYLILLSVLLFPALASAQTLSIYDTWTPTILGSMYRFTITEHEIIATHSSSGTGMELPQFLTVTPQDNPTGTPQVTLSESRLEKSDTVKLLKIIFDSAKAKGRMFIQYKRKEAIIALSFLLIDGSGELQLGFTSDMGKMTSPPKTLKEAEKTTSKSAKKSPFNDLTLSFYNKKRTAEFARMKDPLIMPKAEMLGMINSFGDRMAAAIQKLPHDSNSWFLVPVYKNFFIVAHDLFISHGYNPLTAGALIEKVKNDPEFEDALEVAGNKIQESVPVLLAAKKQSDSLMQEAKNTELIPYGSDQAGIAEARKLMDLKSPLYDATGTLTNEQSENLLKKIDAYNASEKEQTLVVIVSSLHGNTPEKAAHMVLDWNKKARKSPNGSSVIFLAKDDRKGYIATGSRMGIIPDSSIQEIFDNELTPMLKQGKYYEGIDKSIDAVIAKSKTAQPPSLYEVMHRTDDENTRTVDSTMTPMQSTTSAPPPPPPPPQSMGSIQKMHKSSTPLWLTKLSDAFAEAKRTGKNIFIDFTGYTCTNSRAMEQTIFGKADVMLLLQKYVQVRLYTDNGSPENESNRKLEEERFKTIAQPYYVILSPDNKLLATFPGYTRDLEAFVNFLSPYAKSGVETGR